MILAGALLLPRVLCAQAERPVATAVRTSGAIHIDGRLDESAWAAAPAITQFTQYEPLEGQPPSQRTDVRIVYDDVALYVGAWLHDTGPVSTRLGRRDAWLEDSDWFLISLDSHNDRLTAYQFMVNPSGVRRDGALSAGNDHGDDSWDPVWEVATAITDSGWVAELRIPLSQLRFSRADVQEWGLQLERTIGRLQEESLFSFTPKSERGGVARYGRLTGLRGLHPGRGIELVPYAVTKASYEPVEAIEGAPFANPYSDGSAWRANAGLDVKYRLATNLTLDATFNPDFGQVEVDPAVINLTAYETRFEEKRPFFIEGGDIFGFGVGGSELVYSRRMGAQPSARAPGDALYADVPESSTILAAAKLTGRTAGGWALGFGDVVTAEEHAHYALEDGSRVRQVVAPLTNFALARVQKNLREGQTVLGGLLTSVQRRLQDTPLTASLRSDAFSGGIDFTHEWSDRSWSLEGSFAGSHIQGEAPVIAAAQRSSARYFQRPDATHLDYDPARTSLTGWSGELQLSKEAGEHWRGGASVWNATPGFEVNDMGFQRDADRVHTSGELQYVENQPGRVWREWSAGLESAASWNTGGDYLGTQLELRGFGQLLNYWSLEGGMAHGFSGYDDRLTRGGPLTRHPSGSEIGFELSTDERKPWIVEFDVSGARGEQGMREFGIDLGLELKPSEAWSIRFGPEFSRSQTPAQYIGSVADALVTRTYGRRYLFAHLDQTELSLGTRLNVTFRPGLTFELYAQPLIGSGAFDGVKELSQPGTYRFIRYGVDQGTVSAQDQEFVIDPDGNGPAPSFTVEDQDFNERSLRGNAVLRWEWRPGSTLFFVWQQVRESEEWRDDFAFRHSMSQLWRSEARNVFLVKATYWFGR